ncbi:single-stranded DNA-binding protein [Rhodoferax fermentans]|uniref:Single-stranded DNA-binding protein n=1 Tax=Rhodoferax fermentans TaxID=28066 RepID=A0A1T1AT90_RHOFE|nr:single-stranded DNA-binding protein [Rhodoferax fermentans]MBK1682354.1 single-stranded DNA-binding protein [Rhodoferax fermentans]OOV07205.1 single-stranded DNA-binding protein [Rhodoferax fermentans]
MIDGLIAGKLLGDPEQRLGKGESRYVVAKVRAQAGDGEHLIVNVIAFEAMCCRDLLLLRDGDSVALSGSLTPKAWTDKQGNVKPALDLVAQRVLNAYQTDD